MTHLRTEIRNAVASTVTGLSLTGSRVYKTRIYPLDESKLPCIAVYVKSEQILQSTIGNQNKKRSIDIVIDCVAIANANLDSTLDKICEDVEHAMALNKNLNGLALEVLIDQTEIEIDSSGEKPVGIAQITYRAIAFQNLPSPAVLFSPAVGVVDLGRIV
jgi:hypothetical protein